MFWGKYSNVLGRFVGHVMAGLLPVVSGLLPALDVALFKLSVSCCSCRNSCWAAAAAAVLALYLLEIGLARLLFESPAPTKVWSLDQFYSTSFTKSGISVKKCLCEPFLTVCPGTSAPSVAHLTVSLYLCSS